MSITPKLSLGPILFYWSREEIYEFYEQAAELPVDIIYLGETVCSKRRSLNTQEWFDLAIRLSEQNGKQVVLSTLALLEAESELKTLRRICENGRFTVEANDMGAVQILSQKQLPFVTGPSINIYNPATLQHLASRGLTRWVMPLELGKQTLQQMQQQRPENVETEVFCHGRMPLTLSARCFTARSHNLPKDNCQLKCIDYPEGRLLSTQDGDALLAINGIQTVSAKSCNLLPELAEIKRLQVDILRISPQYRNTDKIVNAYAHTLAGDQAEDLEQYIPLSSCDGFWHGNSGIM
ncbi:MAG: U32 family peptidase [Candidatus Thiodiazotropha sp.]